MTARFALSETCFTRTGSGLAYPKKEWVGLVRSIAAGDQGALHARYTSALTASCSR